MAASRPILVLLGVMLGSVATAAGKPEYSVKAAYVYNFAKFVEWPQGGLPRTLTVCICGNSPLTGFLDEAVRGRLVHGVPIEVKRLPEGDADWDPCNAVFFGGANRASIHSGLNRLKGRSILTIGESDAFAESGGMITLVVEEDRVRFDVNLGAVTDAHLQISSKLLELGRVVRPRK
jgi:uncharacterized protein DUF4154